MSALVKLREMSARMAEDDGLWFKAETAAEAYVQQELRKLCASIEEPAAVVAGAEVERVLMLDRSQGVKVGGRLDGWLMRRGADGQWVTMRKLPEEDPFIHTPDFMKPSKP